MNSRITSNWNRVESPLAFTVKKMLNQIPLLQIHGVQSPFNDKWVNRIIGIVFPVGLLFELRAWLFQRKLKRQMVKTSQAAVNLIDYLKQQTK